MTTADDVARVVIEEACPPCSGIGRTGLGGKCATCRGSGRRRRDAFAAESGLDAPSVEEREISRLSAGWANDQARLEALRKHLAAIRAMADEQGNDDWCWSVAQSKAHAYVQRALRRLHAAIKAEP